MTADRITKIQIEGLRVLDNVELDVSGLTVLIGDNGSGKSTILEAFELLRKASRAGSYTSEVLNDEHGPFTDLLRKGAKQLRLGVSVEGAGPRLDYAFSVALVGTAPEITHERLDVAGSSEASEFNALDRQPGQFSWVDQNRNALSKAPNITGQMLAAPAAAMGLIQQDAFVRLVTALQKIELQAPFDVRPLWQQRELDSRRGPRWPSQANHVQSVKRYGQNFPSALLVLRNDAGAWQRFLGRARAALGGGLSDVSIVPAGAGHLEVYLKFSGGRPELPLSSVSEGQLSYLILLATVELGSNRSLVAFDEPEIHYHPELVVNLVHILEDLAQDCPVVIATHSDRLLDALEDPALSVVLTDIQANGSVVLRRPNAPELAKFLENYRGLGAVRSEGYLAHVFEPGDRVAKP